MTKSPRILLLIIFCCTAITLFAQIPEEPNVLILNSTHKGNTFSDRFTTGIESYFRKLDSKINFYFEYLDFMRVPLSDDQTKSLADFLSQKYRKIPIKVIITTDNAGLFFVIKYRNLFGKNIPIVFCGVPPESEDNIRKEKNVSGIYFDYSFKTDFDLANNIFPERDKYIIIHDSSNLGLSIAASIKSIETNYPDKQFSYLNNRSLDEISYFINSVSDKAVVFPTTYSKDRFGTIYSTEQLTSMLANRISAPMFGFLDYQINRGILGGLLYIGYKDGEQTGLMANNILKNINSAESHTSKSIFRSTIFSYERLEKFNISKDKLPKDAIIANKPLTYLQKYETVIIPYVMLIGSLLVFLVVLFIIIRKRNKIAVKLKDNEELFRFLTENAKDIIFRVDFTPEPHFKYISPSVKDVLAIEPEEVYKNFAVLTKLLSREDLSIYANILIDDFDFNRVIELQWHLLDGRIIWTEEKYHPIYNSTHQLIAFEGISREITDRKLAIENVRQSEARLGLVLSANKDGIWDWNILSGKIKIDNRWAEMIGYSIDEIDPDYDFWKSSVHEDDLEETLKRLDNHLSEKTDYYEVEFRFKTKSDDYIWILSRGKIVTYDDRHKPIRMIGTHRDVTEKKKNEKELLKIQKLESLGTLAGGIAHDFNNILTSILGNITLSKMLIKKSFDLEKVTTLLTNSEKSTYKAKDLTQKLLSFSRGGNPIKKFVDPEKMITGIVELSVFGSETETDIKFLTKPWPIEVDEDQIKQAIQNIIVNSIESMNGKGLIKVVIRNYNVNHKFVQNPALNRDNYLRIDIIDEGSGISKENMDKVFDPYFSTKVKAEGLGLSSAYTIIKNHHGHISISSIPEKGTTVTIYLPAMAESIKRKNENKSKLATSGVKILVMDDDDFIRELLDEALSSFGYVVDLTINGDETIRKYSDSLQTGNPYALVIMDLTIPGGKGGKETIMELRAMDPEINAIVSSGYSNDPILSDYEQYGFKGIITKPYNIDILKETIKNIL